MSFLVSCQGQFLSEAGRQPEAADWLLKAVASDPDDFETVFNCANALRLTLCRVYAQLRFGTSH